MCPFLIGSCPEISFPFAGMDKFVCWHYNKVSGFTQLIPWPSRFPLCLSLINDQRTLSLFIFSINGTPHLDRFQPHLPLRPQVVRLLALGWMGLKMASATKYSMVMQILSLILCLLTLSCSAFTSKDYADALAKSILFYEGQRSGKLPSSQRLTWRGDSGLSDGSSYHVWTLLCFVTPGFTKSLCEMTEVLLVSGFQVDLVGGYYDAGDNVKFGLPMAFTTTLLAWSVIEFGNSMPSQIGNARAAIRWSTDYLLKAATATPGTLYVQVSNKALS